MAVGPASAQREEKLTSTGRVTCPSAAEEPHGDAPIAPGAAARMDAVAAALDSNEKWLLTELEAKTRDLEALTFDQPPDF